MNARPRGNGGLHRPIQRAELDALDERLERLDFAAWRSRPRRRRTLSGAR